jgi:hypothetical protein
MSFPKRVLTSAVVGAAVAGVGVMLVKRQMEDQFGQNAEELEQRFSQQSSALRTSITEAAGRAGRAAAEQTLNDFGVTPALVADLQRAIRLANEIQAVALRTGKSLEEVARLAADGARRALAP